MLSVGKVVFFSLLAQTFCGEIFCGLSGRAIKKRTFLRLPLETEWLVHNRKDFLGK